MQLTKLIQQLPQSWKQLLQDEENKEYFISLASFLSNEAKAGKVIYPKEEYVFRALRGIDYEAVRVVILGQDPYHGEGQAIGYSFAVPNALKKKPPSLINIFKEIESDLGVVLDRQQSDLTGWVQQGVLLLNTSLTVQAGQPLSHQGKGWEQFTEKVLDVLVQREKPILFVLWGAHAARYANKLQQGQHKVIRTAHPSPLSAYRGFLGSKIFSKMNEIFASWQQPAIHWDKLSTSVKE